MQEVCILFTVYYLQFILFMLFHCNIKLCNSFLHLQATESVHRASLLFCHPYAAENRGL